MKDQAASDFKAKNYGGATDKYYQVLNIVRSSEGLKTSAAGVELETQSRLNIALCKLNQKEYDVAIDQCERVLDKDSNNWKACFRLATAMYEKNGKCQTGSEGEIRSVHNYAKKAQQANPKDKKLQAFYDEVRAKFEAYETKKAEAAKEKEEERRASELAGPAKAEDKEEEKVPERTAAERKGLKKVIVTDPEEEKAAATS